MYILHECWKKNNEHFATISFSLFAGFYQTHYFFKHKNALILLNNLTFDFVFIYSDEVEKKTLLHASPKTDTTH